MAPDIMARDDGVLPFVDLYTAGPPCQPFSSEGQGAGVHDARGMVFQRVLETIKVVRPTMFILENVTGLKQHKNTYKFIIHTLQHISEARIIHGNQIVAHKLHVISQPAHDGLDSLQEGIGKLQMPQAFSATQGRTHAAN